MGSRAAWQLPQWHGESWGLLLPPSPSQGCLLGGTRRWVSEQRVPPSPGPGSYCGPRLLQAVTHLGSCLCHAARREAPTPRVTQINPYAPPASLGPGTVMSFPCGASRRSPRRGQSPQHRSHEGLERRSLQGRLEGGPGPAAPQLRPPGSGVRAGMPGQRRGRRRPREAPAPWSARAQQESTHAEKAWLATSPRSFGAETVPGKKRDVGAWTSASGPVAFPAEPACPQALRPRGRWPCGPAADKALSSVLPTTSSHVSCSREGWTRVCVQRPGTPAAGSMRDPRQLTPGPRRPSSASAFSVSPGIKDPGGDRP